MSSTMRAVPVARFDNLVTTESGTDLLVYDQRTQHLHHLNAAAATVWRLCDGQRTVDDIVIMAGSSAETVQLAIEQLAAADLLQDELPADQSRPGTSRRSVLRKAAIAGSLPVIVSVTAPLAAQAVSSTLNGSCIAGPEDPTCLRVVACCRGLCAARVQGTYFSGSLNSCIDLPTSLFFEMNVSCVCLV